MVGYWSFTLSISKYSKTTSWIQNILNNKSNNPKDLHGLYYLLAQSKDNERRRYSMFSKAMLLPTWFLTKNVGGIHAKLFPSP